MYSVAGVLKGEGGRTGICKRDGGGGGGGGGGQGYVRGMGEGGRTGICKREGGGQDRDM